MGPLVVADTDVVIDFFAGAGPRARMASDLIRDGRLAITAVTVFELYAGITGMKRLRNIETFVEHILVLPVGIVEAATAGRVYTDLKSRGRLIGNQDLLIAGVCLANSLPLLTGNAAHFMTIPGLRLFEP